MTFEGGEKRESGMEITGVIIPIAEGMLGVSEQEVLELKSAVENSDGKIAVFIHPYSERQQHSAHFSPEEKAQVETYEKAFESFVQEDTSIPLIIMEVNFRVAGTEEALKALAPSRKTYSISTRFEEDAGEGGLSLASPSFTYAAGSQTLDGSWEQMRHVFKYLGVKEVTVGGMYLYNDTSDAGKAASGPNAYNYCVAQVWRNLDKDFDVTVSPITFPISGNEVRR